MGSIDKVVRTIKQAFGQIEPEVEVEEREPTMVETGEHLDFVTPTVATITLGENTVITIEDFVDVRRVRAIVRLLEMSLA